VFDCSSFIKWLYAQRGIWLPRRSVQQRELGEVVSLEELTTGDVIFVSGYINYYINNPADGVGHVGIYTGDKTIIHAANKKSGIVESPMNEFIGSKFRGIKRYIPKDAEVITFQTPEMREVESADDLKWIILQSLV
jgi:cell wall-associated NlpC family hydrolase